MPTHSQTRARPKAEPLNPNWDSETNLLTWLATCVSVLSFLFYYRNGDSLLYGDAIAHINIARRVFDSRTPGLLQLGTVWLPLPHLLIIPFIVSKRMWQSGAGGSIPSMVAYVVSVIGIFRLIRRSLSRNQIEGPARFAAWTAAIIYGANPNLIYMQATAMGETLYLAFFIWAVVYFAESLRGDTKALTRSGLCLAAACLTRYDGWFLAAATCGIVFLISLWPQNRPYSQQAVRFSKPQALKFILIAAAAPALWLAYNGIVYRNPLEFENGPYSAKAIERRTQSAGNPGHPGSGNPFLAGQYFVKSAEDNLAENEWLQRAWILLAVAAAIGAVAARPRIPQSAAALLLLLIPLPFYALSIAYGGVPIFIPQWWPFTHYNARYGLQLLPALSVGLALLAYLLVQIDGWSSRVRKACAAALFAIVAASYGTVWRATPICLEEARTNMRTRTEFQRQLATLLEKLPPDSTLLMYTGDHVGALERAGFSLKHTINEGNHRVWKPTDSEGLWERALADPSRYVDYVLAFEGDPVWQAVREAHLRELVDIHVTGQARAVLYRAR